MNKEQRNEIMKALAMGLDVTEIAKVENVSVYDVENILNECQAEIADRKKFYSEMEVGK